MVAKGAVGSKERVVHAVQKPTTLGQKTSTDRNHCARELLVHLCVLNGENLETHIAPLARNVSELLQLLEPQKPSTAAVYIRMFNRLIAFRKYWVEVERGRGSVFTKERHPELDEVDGGLLER